MASREVTGEGYSSWNLVRYAWKGPVIRSPMTHEPMRAVVGESRSGGLHGGIRIGSAPDAIGPERQQQTTFIPDPTKNLNDAIDTARSMLRERLVDHAREFAEQTQLPGEIKDVVVDARSLAIAEGGTIGPAAKYGESPSMASAAIEQQRKLKL